MAPQLGGSQISALLESVPGIANVLRSPVADALVNMIRAGAGIGPFDRGDAEELVQYAVRRGLIGKDEGDQLLQDVRGGAKARARAARGTRKAARGGHRKAAGKRPRSGKRSGKTKRAGKAVKRTRKKAAKRR